MFTVKEIKEINFSKASNEIKTGLDYFLKDIETHKIPFFWNMSGDAILINKECHLYPITKVYIDRICSCKDIKEQLEYDLSVIDKEAELSNSEAFRSLVKLFYEMEQTRRNYITDKFKKAC